MIEHKFLNIDSFPQGEDYNLTLEKLQFLCEQMSSIFGYHKIKHFKWTAEMNKVFNDCFSSMFDICGRSELSKNEIMVEIYKKTINHEYPQISFIFIITNLIANKDKSAMFSTVNMLHENYTSYANISRFAADLFQKALEKSLAK